MNKVSRGLPPIRYHTQLLRNENPNPNHRAIGKRLLRKSTKEVLTDQKTVGEKRKATSTPKEKGKVSEKMKDDENDDRRKRQRRNTGDKNNKESVAGPTLREAAPEKENYSNNYIGIPAQDFVEDGATKALLCPSLKDLAVGGQNVEECPEFVLLLRFLCAVANEDDEILKLGNSFEWSDIVSCVVGRLEAVSHHHDDEDIILQPSTKKRRLSNGEPLRVEEEKDGETLVRGDIGKELLDPSATITQNVENPTQIRILEGSTKTMSSFCFTFLHRLLTLCNKRLPLQTEKEQFKYHYALERIIGKFLQNAPAERLCLFGETDGANPFFLQSGTDTVLQHWSELTPWMRIRVIKFLIGKAVQSSKSVMTAIDERLDRETNIGILNNQKFWYFANRNVLKDIRVYVEVEQEKFLLLASTFDRLVELAGELARTAAEASVTGVLKEKVNEIRAQEKALLRRERRMKAVYALQQDARFFSSRYNNDYESRRAQRKTRTCNRDRAIGSVVAMVPKQSVAEGRLIRAANRAAFRAAVTEQMDENKNSMRLEFDLNDLRNREVNEGDLSSQTS